MIWQPNTVYLYSMKAPSCPGLEGPLEASDIVWAYRERTCPTCSHAIIGLEGHPSNKFFAVVVGCDLGLRNSSYPCDSYEREPGVD